ncbi:hypothetical protein DB35_15680 [Streptomyces abyssalis]|uniref:Uncharacterized protein n=1 Tax=Streptomyces abyssalis TaxID=933944 RepID=A0A1E7JFT1_9ACTN|nr:hypothetical protein [Streptomyces abyssalis]OEU85325.1 hypothetical protein AN215_22330 [Streptomyces abyssalis]OEU91504.1 hypothetical protein DB35_15680 [Streptomyces abyssalis]OEV28493.1 hypothetical protein AN219_20570 [Streptomyces nanshensis]
MSHPTEPPNNPYAGNPYAQQPPPQQQHQQPYGYPQTPQPGYGFPQQAPGTYQQPVPNGAMASKVNAVRVMMFIAGGLQGLVSVFGIAMLGIAANSLTEIEDVTDAKIGIGIAYVFCGTFLVHAVMGIMLGIWFSKGGSGVRVGGIVWSSFLTLFGLIAFPFGIIWLGLGVTCIVLLAQSGAWFDRPRY